MSPAHVRRSALGGYVASRFYNPRLRRWRRICAVFWDMLGA